jgi:hypothetical protein
MDITWRLEKVAGKGKSRKELMFGARAGKVLGLGQLDLEHNFWETK